jgi:arylformamidase
MYILLSHILDRATPTYGNSTKMGITLSRSLALGDSSNEHFLEFNNHIGTHIDAPYHFDDGGKSLDDFSPEFWICNNPLFIEKSFKEEEIISLDSLKSEFKKINLETDCILLKTGFEKFRSETDIYCFKNPSISPDIPIWLRQNTNIRFFGIDYISISSRANREMGRETHKAFLCKIYKDFKLLSDPILLIEDMNLEKLESSPKHLIISPLFFKNSDGSPATIFAKT